MVHALTIRTEDPSDGPAIEALVDRAFGPGRFVKTAERLREGNVVRADLSFVAYEGERLVGSVRLWPIHVGGEPAIFLGPIAVDESLRRKGLGQDLVERACQAASAAGFPAVLLVGDAPWFERMGFLRAAEVKLPGPVDARRVLFRPLRDDAQLSGLATL